MAPLRSASECLQEPLPEGVNLFWTASERKETEFQEAVRCELGRAA